MGGGGVGVECVDFLREYVVAFLHNSVSSAPASYTKMHSLEFTE